jgi:hypothetical protein
LRKCFEITFYKNQQNSKIREGIDHTALRKRAPLRHFTKRETSIIPSYRKMFIFQIRMIEMLTSPRPGRARVPFQRAHRSHHRFGDTSLIWWAVGGVRAPPHEKRGLSSPSSSPFKRDTRCPSHSPIKPSIELGRSVISVTKRKIELIFKYKGAIHPRSSKRRGFPPP